MASPEDEVSPEWCHWAAVSLLSGMPLAEVISTMADQGVPEPAAARVCAAAFRDPMFEAGRTIAQQHRKLVSVLAMRSTMLDLAENGRVIERRSGVSRKEFLDDYYARNQPLVLEDVCDTWPAVAQWTPEYLAEVIGSAEIEVMSDRDADDDYEINADAHKQHMPFDDYVARVLAAQSTNDLYLVANNHLLESDVAAPLWRDIALDERYLDRGEAVSRTYLWFGAGGTITKLHHDLMNVMFHQVAGWKQFTLISPLDTPHLYNNSSVYSDVDPKSPDYIRFPAYANAHPIHVTVGPGEALFVPVGWWHHVEALEMSISVSTTSFAFPNSIEWFHPERLG